MNDEYKPITAEEEAERWKKLGGGNVRDARIWTALNFANRLGAHAPESHRALVEAALIMATMPFEARAQEAERICRGDVTVLDALLSEMDK